MPDDVELFCMQVSCELLEAARADSTECRPLEQPEDNFELCDDIHMLRNQQSLH